MRNLQGESIVSAFSYRARTSPARWGRRLRAAGRVMQWSAATLLRAAEETEQKAAAPDQDEKKPLGFAYGGQAVIEGVMMRGQYSAAIAVRNPSQEIVVREVPLNATVYRGRIAKLPFVRGLIMLWDALVLGTSALMWSADVALEDEEDIDFSLEGAAGLGLVIVSLAMGIGLFFVLPAAASAAVKDVTGLHSKLAADVIEGLFKLGLLIGYIAVIGQMKDVKRLFGYHGAEHKTINAYEAGAELAPATVAQHSIQHPRCGTAFLLTLVALSVAIHILTGRPDSVIVLLLSRVGLIFPIAGIAYEVIRFSSKHLENPLVRQMVKPNLALQRLTTRQPDLEMIEVGIAALERVLESERMGVPAPAPRVAPASAAPVGD